MSTSDVLAIVAVVVSGLGVLISWRHGHKTRRIAEKAALAAERSAVASEASAELEHRADARAAEELRPRLRITKAICRSEGNDAQGTIQAEFENYGKQPVERVTFRAVVIGGERYDQGGRLALLTPGESRSVSLYVPVGAVLKKPTSLQVEVSFRDAHGPREESILFDGLEHPSGWRPA